jgi:hypothetical protein
MPSVREVIPAMVGIGTFHEDQGGDELPAIVIE